jgi:hypothetical protein
MLKLTDQEKQEIIRHFEKNRELPEKYRFLLFEDKREVELVWNGKTNEVCNIVLPFQTREQVDEPRTEQPTTDATQFVLFSTDARGRQYIDKLSKEVQPVFHGRAGTAAQGLDQQAHSFLAQERTDARRNRGAGRTEADVHRSARRCRRGFLNGH